MKNPQPVSESASADLLSGEDAPGGTPNRLVSSSAWSVLETSRVTERRRRRRIGLHHMAFIRGVYEGLDIGALAEQYLGNLGDRRRANSTLRWLVDELANAARKRGDSAGARLLRLPTAKLIDTTSDSEAATAATAAPDAGATSLGQHADGMREAAQYQHPSDVQAPPHLGAASTTTSAAIIESGSPAAAPATGDATSADEVDTLEAFRDRHDPDGVYSEAELIDLFQEAQDQARIAALSAPESRAGFSADAVSQPAIDSELENGRSPSAHGNGPQPIAARVAHAARLRARNQRLRTRRREVLDRLEASLVEPPRLHHFIGDWIDPALAQRLESVDVKTVGDLLSLINRRGFHWYRDVPRVGRRAAQRLQDWLTMNAGDLGAQIARHAAMPRRQWSTSVAAARRVTSEHLAAIEYFTPEDEQVASDRALLLQLLDRHKHSASTYRSFRLQAERLLLWTALHRQVPIQRLSDDDVQAYFAFMQAPDAEWCGPKVERGLPTWRPFEGPASEASVRIARRSLKALFAPIVAEGLLPRNPFTPRLSTPISMSSAEASPVETVADHAERKIEQGRVRGPYPIHLARMRLLAHVQTVSGLRMSDIATLRVNQIDALSTYRGETAHDSGIPSPHGAGDTLRAVLSEYLAMRQAQSGPIDGESLLFVRHTAIGVDLATASLGVPADTLVRVLGRYKALCRSNPDFR